METKLHLGCGRRFLKGFIHIDIADYNHIDYKQSVDKLPQFPDNSVDLIYASHVLEYFDRDKAIEVLREWHRVLRPFGVLRLSVPDFVQMIYQYQTYPDINCILGPLFGKMKAGDETIYHKIVFDEMSLGVILRQAGFKRMRKWDWEQTHPEDFDDHSMAHYMTREEDILTRNFARNNQVSLNIEAIK